MTGCARLAVLLLWSTIAPAAEAAGRHTPASRPAGRGQQRDQGRPHPANYCSSCERDAQGRIARSRTVRREFQRLNPCPATGAVSGPCDGYVIDHITPLRRGGADSIENMQWQQKAEASAKDRKE